MKLTTHNRGYTIIEMGFSSAVVSIVGATLYSIVNMTTVLGAKNTAINTAHQQARTAMVQMLQDLHSAITLPYLVDVNGDTVSGAGPAAGIGFQEGPGGPYRIIPDASTAQNRLNLTLTAGTDPLPVPGQRLIVP